MEVDKDLRNSMLIVLGLVISLTVLAFFVGYMLGIKVTCAEEAVVVANNAGIMILNTTF